MTPFEIKEERTQEWIQIQGTNIKFYSPSTASKIYCDGVILVEKGKITGNILDFKPMYHFHIMATEGNAVDLYLDNSNAVLFAASIVELTKPSSVNEYFMKTPVTDTWTVKQQYINKQVWRRNFTSTTYFEIYPVVDERKLRAYKVLFYRDKNVGSVIFTCGELEMLAAHVRSFSGLSPLYLETFEQRIMREQIRRDITDIRALRDTIMDLSLRVNKINDELTTFKLDLKNELTTAISSSIATIAAFMNKTQQMITNEPISGSPVSNGVLLRESVEEHNEEDSVIIDAERGLLETDEIETTLPETQCSKIEEDPTSAYFRSLEALIDDNRVTEEDYVHLTESLRKELQKDDDIEILNIEDIEKLEKERERENYFKDNILAKDDYIQELNTKLSKPIADTEKEGYINGDLIYPKEYYSMISKELSEAEISISAFPKDKFDEIKSFDLDEYYNKVKSLMEKNVKYSNIHYMLDSQYFNKSNITSVIINKGRIGIPVSTIVNAIGHFAASYEMVANGEDPIKSTGMCMMEAVQTDLSLKAQAKTKINLYGKYIRALNKVLVNSDQEYPSKKLFALDKLVLKGTYEYSYFDMKLDLTKEEQLHLLKAMIDVYFLCWYSEMKYMTISTVTPVNYQMYSLTNKLMYRFARTLILNYLHEVRQNGTKDDLKQVTVTFMRHWQDFKNIVERLDWNVDVYNDAVRTLLVFNNLVKKYVDGNENTGTVYIHGTNIYKGIPCEKALEILKDV